MFILLGFIKIIATNSQSRDFIPAALLKKN